VTAMAAHPVILLVEDDADHTELVRRAIEELAPEVRLEALADGELALDYLFRRGEWAAAERSPRPDLVLLDLRLPRLDGFSVLHEIKSAPALRHVPVVIWTMPCACPEEVPWWTLGMLRPRTTMSVPYSAPGVEVSTCASCAGWSTESADCPAAGSPTAPAGGVWASSWPAAWASAAGATSCVVARSKLPNAS